MGPFALTFFRFFPAGCLLLYLSRKELPHLVMKWQDTAKLLLIAGVGITLTYSIYFTGLQRTNSTDASLLFACEPILLSLAATAFLREKLSHVQWLGLLVGLYGIWVIAGRAGGNWLALLGLSCECSTAVLAKELIVRYPPIALLGIEMVLGGLLSLPGALFQFAHHSQVSITSLAIANIIYLSLICSALCYGIWYKLMRTTPLSQMSAFILVQPLLGPFYGHYLHGDLITATVLEGAAFVCLGIVLSQIKTSVAVTNPAGSTE
jgi:drug/metabolite transporter (DMT)-like permease